MNRQTDNPVVFVGAGPGDPNLVTVAGKNALEKADLVVYAGSLVSQEMLTWCQPECETISSAGLNLDQIVETMAKAHGQGKKVVRLQTGDISLYGALPEQLAALADRGIPWRIIPGVTAAFAAAAALGLSYTLPESCQSLIFTRAGGRTPMPEAENLASMAAHGCSIAIYLSAALSEEVGPDPVPGLWAGQRRRRGAAGHLARRKDSLVHGGGPPCRPGGRGHRQAGSDPGRTGRGGPAGRIQRRQQIQTLRRGLQPRLA